MAHHRKASRKHSRRHSRKARRATRRSHRRQRKQRGGVAPVNYDLANGWSSKASLAQGADFFKYHAQQHGGSAPYPMAVSGAPFLPTAAQGPAMMSGLNKAMADIAGLKDPQPQGVVDMGAMTAAPTTQVSPGPASLARGVPPTSQTGGRKRHSRKHSSRKHHSRKHRGSKRHHASHRRRRHRGGGLGYASVSAPGMLLPSSAMYDQAGLNPSYRTGGVEVQMAEIRDQQ
jgi:hypothetical protein